ncbi:MAG: response regulator [Sphingobium sp.]|jgi:CheY-like chemotaxis protein|nr:response regulator [Sphingobium sp.]
MRVLYVEDDPMNRRVVNDMLNVVGARMTEAESAELGLARLDEQDYDIILMDLRMPGMDGLTAIQHIRARSDSRGATPVVVVTADTSIDLRDRCLSVGADDVMQKPVAMAPLLKAMTKVVGASRKKTAA